MKKQQVARKKPRDHHGRSLKGKMHQSGEGGKPSKHEGRGEDQKERRLGGKKGVKAAPRE